jgi:hypothetical protein
VVSASWLPTLYPWTSIDATDIAMIVLTLMATVFASAVPVTRLVVAVVAVATVLVCVLMVTWAAADLAEAAGRFGGVFERFRGVR